MPQAVQLGSGTLHQVTPQELVERLQSGTAIAIDVRESPEHATGTITGAELLPLSCFDLDRVEALRAEGALPIFFCRSGGRTAKLAAHLVGQGWTEVVHLDGGILGWIAEGLPIEKPIEP